MAASPPTWQMRIGTSIWTDFDSATSGLFEAGFVSGTTHIVQITGRISMSISGPSVVKDFDVHKMEWGGIPVRRACNAAVPTTVEFWDDDAWEPLDSYAQCLLGTAMAIGREKLAIHMGTASYDISLTPGNGMQTNRNTGRSRPLRINGSISPIMGDSDGEAEEDDDEEDSIKDDPSMPNEFRCPITQMPMKKPVMLCDGHTYECRAIQKWLMKKLTSPVTGKALDNVTLTVNHALKKLIRDWDSVATALRPAGAKSAGAKSSGAGGSLDAPKNPLEEEDLFLFGSDDDDDGFKAMPDAAQSAAPLSMVFGGPPSMVFGETSSSSHPKKRMKSMRK